MLHSSSSPPLQSLLQRNCSPLKQNSTMNGPGSAQDSYFIFDELSTALPERNNNSDSSKIIGNNSFSMQSNKSSSVGSSIGGSTNTSTATNLSSTFQRPQYNQQQQRFGFGEFWLKQKQKSNKKSNQFMKNSPLKKSHIS
jgi:hypothetical protein